jgi:uncharacterized protein (TIGR02099 family)
MLKVARYLHGKFWLVMAWLVIALAILLTAARLLLPSIDLTAYQPDIEQIIEADTGKLITIGALQAELRGFRLALKFTDVTLFNKDESQALLHAREVHIDIRLLKSLWNGKLNLGSAVVVGTRLLVERHVDGSLSLQGLEGGGGRDPDAVGALLLGQSHLRLFDSEILLKGAVPGRPPLRLSGVAVDLLNDGGRHQLSIKAKIGAEAQESVRLIADLHAGEVYGLAMSGRLYLKCEHLKIGGRLAEWLPQGYHVEQGNLQVELWGDVEKGGLQRLQGTTELTDLQANGPAIPTPFQLERLASQFNWRQQGGGWQLDMDRLVLARNGHLWPPGRLSIAWQDDETKGRQLRLGADYLSLKELNDFVSIIQLPNQALGEALTGLSADGHLTRFGFALMQPIEGEARWRVAGVVARYTNQPWQSVPGLAGLRLSFEGNQSGGWLRINSDDFSIDFPRLFRRPITAKRLAGDFNWRFDTQTGLHLSSNRLEMRNDDVETLSRIDLQLPLSGKDLFVDLQTDFWNGDGSQKSDYLPVGIMPPALVKWLDRSVVSGHVNTGSFLLYGPLKSFPFREQEGRFEVWFGVEDLVLDYMPGWPRIEQGLAEAHFVNNSLQVSLTDGLLLGNRLQQAHAQIRALKGASPVEIEGDLSGPFDNMLKLLDETPLRERFADFVGAIEVSGEAKSHINLAIPLKKSDRFKIDGKIDLAGAGMKIKPANLSLQAISGELQFDEKQVTAQALQARVMDQQVSIDITPKLLKKGRWTRVSTRLNLDTDHLKRQFPDWWLPPMKGSAESSVSLEIAHQASRVPVNLRITSNLRGLAVNLPAPLDKSAKASRKMDLSVDFRRDRMTDLRLLYGKSTHAWLRLPAKQQQPLQGAIGFGQAPSLPEKGKGYHFSGQMNALNADQWIEWFNENASGDGAPTHLEIDLQVKQLKAAAIDCPNAHFTVKNYADGYRVGVESDTVQGQIQVPGNLQQLPLLGRFDFIKLNLKSLAASISGPERKKGPSVNFNPKSLPAMDLSVDELYINDLGLGKSHLAWQKVADGITITQLNVVGKKLDLSGQGYWRMTNKGHITALNFTAHITSLGDLQRSLGLTTGIEDAPTDIKAELYWPSSPLEVGAEKLYGSLWLKMGKGQVEDVDPGVGRLIGLFSLSALGKRLALDFRDVFSHGFSFDSIEGNFTIQDGVARTNDLVMQSSSARVEFSGETGLAKRNYNQRVVVTPHLSATLPLVGALAVNPTVGVALALTQKVLGKRFDKIVQRTYEVTGSWDEPIFKLIDKKPLAGEGAGNEAYPVELPGR